MNNQQAFSVGYESGYYDCHHSGVKKLDLRWRQNRDEFDSVALREQIAEIIQERLQWCGVCNDFLDAEDQEDIKRRIKQGDTLTEQAVDRVFSLITGEADA